MNPKDSFDTNPPVKFPAEPEENILYFIEKNAPNLEPWKKELIRIVRKTAQYFSPQGQTKVMNEGWATMSHYLIINKLYEEKIVDDGFMIEFLKSHTNVISQPEFDSPYYSGINPYTLGFNIFMDIKRICENPTEEDKKWFPNLIGKDWLEEAHYAMENFKDDSFVLQYLSPKVIRDMKLFLLSDDSEDENYHINAIHNERGYEKIREKLSTQYSRSRYIPNIQITHVDKYKTRRMSLSYYIKDGKKLLESEAEQTVNYLQYLWEFPVRLYEQHEDGKKKIIAKAE
jgi:spore cortex formation protein SpoVR/YcgB (stage V sporulation)